MSGPEIERHLERSRGRLARLRERAELETHGSASPVHEAVEELGQTLEELAITLEELSSTNEELAEAQLAAEEHARRYLDLFRFAPDAYVITDARGVLRELNAMAEQQLGGPARFLAGKPLLSCVVRADRDDFLRCLEALRQRRGRISGWLIRFGRDGGFTASVSAVPELRDGTLEIRWTLRDVSALRERDAFRDEIERHLEAIVWLHQLDPLRTLHVSPAYESVLGQPLSALHEDPLAWMEAIHPDDRAGVETAFERLRAGEGFDVEYRIRREDGELRWIHDRRTAFEDSGGHLNRAAGIAEDVTQKKLAQAALAETERRRRAAALAAEHAETRERRALARDLHDAVSQSLALARAKLAALCDEAPPRERARLLREAQSLIADADERARTLTFRLSPPILHDLGLGAAAEWLAEDLRDQLGLRVVVEDDERPKPLAADALESLFRSLRELLVNVARHAQTEQARVTLSREDATLTVGVEDEGVGFDPRGPGGFGLVSVRERVEGLGGRLEVESGPHRGTRVRMVVPLCAPGGP
jgi:PAS domain S-box-containing protein